jgi:hypothetical protein
LVKIIDVPCGTVPKFSGTIAPAEWTDAYCDTFRINHKEKAYIPDSFWVKFNQDTLYLVLKTPSYASTTIAAHWLLFDTLMGRKPKLKNNDIRLTIFSNGDPVEYYGDFSWVLTPATLWRSGYSANTDLATEFVVPLNKIGITSGTDDSVGFSIFADGASHCGCWPSSADSVSPITWAVMTSSTGWNGVAEQPDGQPKMWSFSLANAYPNPANKQVTLGYQLPASVKVKLNIYNVAGQLVKSFNQGYQPAGLYTIRYGTDALTNGIYFYQLDAGIYQATKRMLIIK